jgi:hypothetical protein
VRGQVSCDCQALDDSTLLDRGAAVAMAGMACRCSCDQTLTTVA